jgi:peptidoglycan/LPS O-acetylase OafA/YrhL
VSVGDWSYSLYLWHLPVIWFCARGLLALGFYYSLSRSLLGVLEITPCLVIAFVSFSIIERPSMALISKYLKGPRGRVSTPAVAASGNSGTTTQLTRLSFADIFSGRLARNLFNPR